MELFDLGDLQVRRAKLEDTTEIAKEIRERDKEEVWASHHLIPEEAVKQSFLASLICWTAFFKDKPVAIFGVAPVTLLGNQGSVWLLATKDFSKISNKFIKRSRAFIDLMANYYPYLFNWVDARNTESVKWLSFCGAEIAEAKPFGIDQLPFHFFSFNRRH